MFLVLDFLSCCIPLWFCWGFMLVSQCLDIVPYCFHSFLFAPQCFRSESFLNHVQSTRKLTRSLFIPTLCHLCSSPDYTVIIISNFCFLGFPYLCRCVYPAYPLLHWGISILIIVVVNSLITVLFFAYFAVYVFLFCYVLTFFFHSQKFIRIKDLPARHIGNTV